MRVTTIVGLGVVVLSTGACTLVAQGAPGDPPYVVRGRQVEARQRELQDRLMNFHAALTEGLRRDAPDLLRRLEAPPRRVSGYAILPRIVADAPPQPPAKPQVVSYSWPWSETLIGRLKTSVERLEADLGNAASASAEERRSAYDAIVTGYKKIVDDKRPVDSDIDYNWLWQREIAANPSRFDRTTRLLDTIRDRQSRGESMTPEILSLVAPVAPPQYVDVGPRTGHARVVTVPVYTDIGDAAFTAEFSAAVENAWRLRVVEDTYYVRLTMKNILPEPLAKGTAIDIATHVARFPRDGAVLTTGAASTHVTANRVIVLAPHDIAPRTLAHEFGHVLGFPDGYVRGYRDLGADGYQIQELVIDPGDVMSGPGTGSVLARHFEQLIDGAERRYRAR